MPLLMCPNCSTSMQNVSRSGVEIDMCPSCRGVWLDRGELEKLLGGAREEEVAERSARERFDREVSNAEALIEPHSEASGRMRHSRGARGRSGR